METPSSVFAALVLLTTTAAAIPMMPESIPVARLVEQSEAVVAKEPKNAEAEYTLARIHYLAFVCATQNLDAYKPQGGERLPTVGPFQKFTQANTGAIYREARARSLKKFEIQEAPAFDSRTGRKFYAWENHIVQQLQKSGWQPEDLDDASAAAHIAKALGHFHGAQTLAPRKALYWLGYASLLEQAFAWARRHPKAIAPEPVRSLAPKMIRDAYLHAWEMEVAADLKDKERRGMFDDFDMVSYEAGKAYVRLAELDAPALTKAEKQSLARVKKSLVDLGDRSTHAVTPIIFSTGSIRGIAELLAPDIVVDFPIRGYGPDDHWPWVKPDTALLVWNPSRSGHVQTGAQLFGGYTWELFWKTGYEPLAVLDADGDGELRGTELDDLAAWFDRDGNGFSDPGEVQPISELGIVAIATHATTADGRHPMNPRGATFSDGRELPTWDWIVEPLERADHPKEPSRLTAIPNSR